MFLYSHTTSLAAVVFVLVSIAPVLSQGQVSAHDFSAKVLPLLEEHCVHCHSSDDAEAGIRLDVIQNQQHALTAGKTWLRVFDAVASGTMPPSDELPLNVEQRDQIIRWTNDVWSRDHSQEPRGSVLRRLNRREYDNTIRDLFGMELNVAASFPADDIAFGFDNIGSAQKLAPIHLERYLAAAETVLGEVVKLPDVANFAPVELIGLRTYPLAEDGKVEFEHHLEPGRYLVEFSLVRAGIDEAVRPPRLNISFGTDVRDIEAVRVQDETVMYRFWILVAQKDAAVQVKLSDIQPEQDKPAQKASANVSGDQRYGKDYGLHVDSMVVRGPVLEQAKAGKPGVGFNLAYAELLDAQADRSSQAKKVLGKFARRAFRRPVSEAEIQQLFALFQLATSYGESFERALQMSMTAALVSPKFLFLAEPEADGKQISSDYRLASRLSYFLWSSMPDEELMRVAEEGTLNKNLRPQVRRMLEDPKSQAFVQNFVGQWLQLRNLEEASPDEELFREFDEQLRTSMRRETEELFAYLIRENRSCFELIDPPYSFLNDTLAKHYGIAGVKGSSFRKHEFSDRRRGGLLTHASVLTLTSNHNRTSPVKRGQWIMQQILGTPPPPPPPDVALLDESQEAMKAASLRARLEAHRSKPECISCHQQMDPLGFALENFDAIGRWRDEDGEFEIDASGVLPGDRSFEDITELKRILTTTESRRFTWTLIENMLVYGLGRGLEPRDYQLVERIRQQLVEHDNRVQEIVFAVVESDEFQHGNSEH